jgi:hypothetical protein
MLRPPEQHLCTRLQLLSGMNERIPSRFDPGVIREIGEQQAFDGASARHPNAEEPGWKDFRVVHHEQIAFAQKPGKLLHMAVLDLAGVTTEDQQARRAALGCGRLRDQLVGQIEVEI